MLAALVAGCATAYAPAPLAPWEPARELGVLAADDELRVGAGRADISPDHAVPLAGYGAFLGAPEHIRWSRGVHDPLYADALYFEKGADRLLLVTFDLVGVTAADLDPLRDDLARETLVDRDRIIVSSSHTHHAPDTLGLWGTGFPPRSGRDERYMTFMKRQAVLAAKTAVANRRPAELLVAVGADAELHMNIHDVHDPQATLDDALTVLIAKDRRGGTIATLTNWSCHATCESMPNRLVSADWVGYFRRGMAARSPGQHIYVNGAIGASVQPNDHYRDAHIRPGEDQNFRWAKLLGESLAEKTAALMATARPVPFDRIEVRRTMVPTHFENTLYDLAKKMGILSMRMPKMGEVYRIEATAVKMGPVRFGTFPGELIPNLGLDIRRSVGGEAQVLVGLSQDYLGYILDEQRYRDPRYGYEKMLCVGPDLGVNLVRAYAALGFE
jgi:hypothetical protein